MDTKFEEKRDPETNRLRGIYCQEAGVFEIKYQDRIMRMQFPPSTPVEFTFRDSDPVA